ncbi:ATP-binding protein [Ochrobactrum sp. GPK 3]|uniref:sensor histidine kinase n=1 Tax=Brucella sp. 22210 TaxID=3453892 RepID=UPI0031385BF7
MQQIRLDTSGILRWYWISVFIVVVIASGVEALVIYRDYSTRKNDAGQKAMMIAQALAEQTTQVVTSLDALSNAVAQDETDKIVDENLMSEVLKRRSSGETKAIIGIAVVNEFGRVTSSGVSTIPVGLDLTKSTEYKALSGDRALSVFFNHPDRHEIEMPKSCVGQIMTYSRAIHDAQGVFRGFILILVNEHYLYNFYDRFNKEPGIILGLVGDDGVIRASNYGLGIGRNIKSYIDDVLATGQGIQVRISPIVNYELVFAYYKSSAAPLWAYAGFPTKPIRTAWLIASGLVIVALLALFAVMVACGIILGKYLKSQKELLRRDIDTFKEKQELEIFETIVSASDIIMVVTNADGQIIVANRNYQDIFAGTETIKRLPVKAMLGVELDSLSGKRSWQGTYTVRLPNHKRREMSWVVSILRDQSDGSVRNFVILGLDITERREAELALYQSSKLLTLGQMATGIAHEISQPLATLAMMLDNLDLEVNRGHTDTASVQEQIGEMSRQVERASTIAKHMRIYGHKTDGSLSVLDPNEIIHSVLAICTEQLKSDRIVIASQADTAVPKIIGNQILIEQILLNFIVNARDAIISKGNGIALHDANIRIKIMHENTGYVCFCVQDNGTGLNETVEEKLFDPFFTTKPPGQGMGLGLALCHGMAKDMKGNIEAKNVDEGAMFILKLPKAETETRGGNIGYDRG